MIKVRCKFEAVIDAEIYAELEFNDQMKETFESLMKDQVQRLMAESRSEDRNEKITTDVCIKECLAWEE